MNKKKNLYLNLKINQILINQKKFLKKFLFIKKQHESQKNLNKIIFSLPNIALDDVPLGKDEKSNKLIKKVGKIKDFSFKVKSHIEIGSKKKILILILQLNYLDQDLLF